MSFWNTSDGENAAANAETDFETGGGTMEPIPANTRLKAMIEDAGWSEFGDDQFINIRWSVLAPEDYKNRKVFQKVKVFGTSRDKDPDKTADKAKKMLAAIDANCGGSLAKVDGVPSDSDLQAGLLNKLMVIEVQEWGFTGDDGQYRSGNWVSAVSSGSGVQSQPAQPAQQADPEGKDIPF